MGLFNFFSKTTDRKETPRIPKAPPRPPAVVVRRETTPPPAVPPVGARGETDLAPSRVNLVQATYPSAEGGADDVDRAALRELFSDIAEGQAAPVRTFIADLRAKNANAEWLEICRPVMAVLHESATSLGLDDVVAPMNQFLGALELAAEGQDGREGPIDGAARELLLEAYGALAKVLPAVFGPGKAVSRRDTMLFHALLKQVQGVGIVTLDELYSAGIISVDTLSHASPSELSATTAISMPVCEAICNALDEHKLEVDRVARFPEEQRFAMHLAELLRALARQHEAFELVDSEAGFDETRALRKRAARRDRDLRALKIEAALIEMGEVECADALRVLSFGRRIEHLENFLGVRVSHRAAERP